jgi:hypothetical protein
MACGGRILLFFALLLSLGTEAFADETGFAGMHDWRKERGIMCFADHFHGGAGKGRTKKAARHAAIKAWRVYTATEYGTDWAYFGRAASKSTEYTREANGWSALVQARPCNPKRRR